MTVVGMIVFPLCLLLWFRPVRLLELLMLAGAFPASAALVLGGLGLQPALPPTLGFIAYAMLQRVLGARYPGDGIVRRLYAPFLFTVAWTVAGSIILPRLFMNSVLVWPQKSDAVGGRVLLAPSFGNITQDIYLLINVTLMALAADFLTRSDIRLDRLYRAYLLSGWVVCGLCFWQFAHRMAGVPFPDEILYSNPGWAILNTQMAGVLPRINASFSEPSACAAYLCGVLYSTVWASLQGHRQIMVKGLIPFAAVALFLTTSTTGFVTVAVGCLLLPAVAMATGAARMLGRLGRLAMVAAVIGGTGCLVLVTVAPSVVPAAQFVLESTSGKRDSQSYQERSTADLDAMTLVPQTFGLGTGWGSNRASSLVPGLLSTIGIIGVIGLLVFDVRLVRGAMAARRAVLPCAEVLVIDGGLAALAGRMIAAIVAGPTIGMPDFYLMIAMVLAATGRIAVQVRQSRRSYAPATWLALPMLSEDAVAGSAAAAGHAGVRTICS